MLAASRLINHCDLIVKPVAHVQTRAIRRQHRRGASIACRVVRESRVVFYYANDALHARTGHVDPGFIRRKREAGDRGRHGNLPDYGSSREIEYVHTIRSGAPEVEFVGVSGHCYSGGWAPGLRVQEAGQQHQCTP